ncbi:hypothetical protein OBBRIDRAFT_773718 [Obba rivulosa]|uniref:Protein kinase domain-containing protein n=1 Tax=Obba rivulosa TaxID=1052685 RepID=A0A8E2AXA2_9APHY|nr:hypothetical protein OBBRIDRAFT_773718 [Obba rivulosa]
MIDRLDTQPQSDRPETGVTGSPRQCDNDTPPRKEFNDQAFFAEIDRSQTESMWGYDHFRLWTDRNDDFESCYVSDGQDVYYGSRPFYVHLADNPGTLSGDILRGERGLPRYDCNIEIVGNDIKEVEFKKPFYPWEVEGDERYSEHLNEDAKDLLYSLFIIACEETQHFTKHARTHREIEVLLKCRGSYRVAQLLGRTEDNRLVFPTYERFIATARIHRSIANVHKWMLGVIHGLSAIHSAGYTYCDFRLDNLLGDDPIILADLECTLATPACMAPELTTKVNLADEDYTVATDIYGLGHLLRGLYYANNLRSRYIDWPVPPPFKEIYEACTQHDPINRPSLAELQNMFENIVE